MHCFFCGYMLESNARRGCVVGKVEEHVRCTATSSGLLSRNRFRVLLPMSLASTRVTGSPQLLFPKSKLNLPVGPDVDADMLSRSMAIPWSGNGVGESESGVETKPPKLESEMGESSDERLRLKPIVDAVGGRCNARWGCGWVASDLVEADDELRRRDAIWNATASDVLGLGSGNQHFNQLFQKPTQRILDGTFYCIFSHYSCLRIGI